MQWNSLQLYVADITPENHYSTPEFEAHNCTTSYTPYTFLWQSNNRVSERDIDISLLMFIFYNWSYPQSRADCTWASNNRRSL